MNAQRCARAENATGGAWGCVREAGHSGPCAAELLARPESERCLAELDWHPRDADLRGDITRCELPRGHAGQHIGRVEWT